MATSIVSDILDDVDTRLNYLRTAQSMAWDLLANDNDLGNEPDPNAPESCQQRMFALLRSIDAEAQGIESALAQLRQGAAS